MTDALRTALAAALGPGFVLGEEMNGGMSRVFIATDTALDRRVVVKTLGDAPLDGPDADRFRREILLAAGLQHPNIVPLLSAGTTSDGTPFYVMPFVAGETLRMRLARGAVPPHEVAALLRDVARALGAAHRRGIVHRDIKPENIFLADGVAVVSDFGVAKAVDAALQGRATATGTAVGTPAYMAPEQASGDPGVGARADLYSLGLVAWELLAGRHPFEGRPPMAMLVANLQEQVPSIADTVPHVPPALAEMIDALLQKLPARRPTDADSVVTTLTTVITPRAVTTPAVAAASTPTASIAPNVSSRGGVWMGGVAVFAITLVVVLWSFGSRGKGPRADASSESPGRWASVQWAEPITEVRVSPGDSVVRGVLDEASAIAGVTEVVDDGARSAPAATAITARRRGDVLIFESSSGRPITAIQLSLPRAELVERATGVLLAAAAPELGAWTLPASRPPRAAAVRRFLTFDGVVRSRQGSTRGGIQDLLRLGPVIVADSSEWAMGALLAMTRVNLALWPERDAALARYAARRETLGGAEQTLLDVLLARQRGDDNAARVALGDLAQRSGSKEFGRAYGLILAESRGSFPEAEDLLLRLGPGPGREHLTYWAILTRIEHLLGKHDRELQLADAAIVESGSRVGVHLYRIRALAGLGRAADVTAELRQLDALPEDVYVSAGWSMRLAADELRVHGRQATADSVLRAAEEWYRTHDTNAHPARDAVERAQLLVSLGRGAEAIARIDAVVPAGAISERELLAMRALVRDRVTHGADTDALWQRWRESREDGVTASMIERNYLRDTGVLSGESALAELRRAALRGDTTAVMSTLSSRFARIRWPFIAMILHADPDFASIRDLPAVSALIAPP